jgi:hypothetical protein
MRRRDALVIELARQVAESREREGRLLEQNAWLRASCGLRLPSGAAPLGRAERGNHGDHGPSLPVGEFREFRDRLADKHRVSAG